MIIDPIEWDSKRIMLNNLVLAGFIDPWVLLDEGMSVSSSSGELTSAKDEKCKTKEKIKQKNY